MKTEKPKHYKIIRAALEWIPILAFFVGYFTLKETKIQIFGETYQGFILVTMGFIPLVLISTGSLWWLDRKIPLSQVITAVLVLVFGGLSVAFNNEQFFKMKPTFIYVLFAVIIQIGLWQRKMYISLIIGQAIRLNEQGWFIISQRLVWFFCTLSIANELVWRYLSTDMWVNFKTFGLPLATLAFFAAQARVIKNHAVSSESDKPIDKTE